MVLVKATQKSGSNSIVCGKRWLVATRTFQLSFVARQSTYIQMDIMLMAQLVLVSGMVALGATVYSRGRLGLPIASLRRPPQSVDAGGSGRQTVSPAAAHHTTTSLSLPSALLWCPARSNQTLLCSAQTPSPAPGESQLTSTQAPNGLKPTLWS